MTLTSRESQVVQLLKQRQVAAYAELADQLKVSGKTVQRACTRLAPTPASTPIPPTSRSKTFLVLTAADCGAINSYASRGTATCRVRSRR